jgi:hypothetical protein
MQWQGKLRSCRLHTDANTRASSWHLHGSNRLLCFVQLLMSAYSSAAAIPSVLFSVSGSVSGSANDM